MRAVEHPRLQSTACQAQAHGVMCNCGTPDTFSGSQDHGTSRRCLPREPFMSGHDRRVFVRARVVATATAWVRGICKGSYIVENLSLGGVQLSGGPAIRVGE